LILSKNPKLHERINICTDKARGGQLARERPESERNEVKADLRARLAISPKNLSSEGAYRLLSEKVKFIRIEETNDQIIYTAVSRVNSEWIDLDAYFSQEEVLSKTTVAEISLGSTESQIESERNER